VREEGNTSLKQGEKKNGRKLRKIPWMLREKRKKERAF